MAPGAIDSQIVESPITEAKVNTAAELVVTNTSATAQLSVTSFNQGRSILIVGIERA